jgi:tetratricopeptide (TPR) repeat protein
LAPSPPSAAARIEDLPGLWEHAPAPPSKHDSSIPAALDALIASLLSSDALARPSNAAAAIEALTLIGGIAPDTHELAAESYLLSGRLVGRSAAQAWFGKRIARTSAGAGSQILMTGAAGLGKTRLLHELFEGVLPQFEPHARFNWLPMRGHCAAALNRAGLHARAKQLLSEALALADPRDECSPVKRLEAERQLALADAGLGDHTSAIRQLDRLLARWGDADNPLFIGLLHKARAEIAVAMRDEPALLRHFAELERCFRATHNPALIAQLAGLAT